MNALLTLLTIAAPALGQIDDFASVVAPRPAAEAPRDPSALVIPPRKRAYPGGADEEDLRVQPALADAEIKMDSRTLQRDVYKSVFNQELKEERHDDAEE